jgi:hypothetical protein
VKDGVTVVNSREQYTIVKVVMRSANRTNGVGRDVNSLVLID